ncbi:hypothetical protein OSB04_un000663 [Centaurea solstitialis]|uniref:Reverse transcriptase zinc-binding domain-containing protein n=1 Tax=Centaurea solstitialis TaxID=347529 RepID=A0AA38VVA8_9ASTR|nr:hypothetical protein OSB04_un000663 [Centaurea solstitialis]
MKLSLRFIKRQDNSWKWVLEADGGFLVKSLRKCIDDRTLEEAEKTTMWSKVVPGKINLFIWRLRIDRLPTRVNLAKRGIEIQSTACPLCNRSDEHLEHVFLNCSTAKEIMAHLVSWWPKLDSIGNHNSIDELLSGGDRSNWSKFESVKYDSVVRAFLWVLWSFRNDRCFNGVIKNIPTLALEHKDETFITGFSDLWFGCRNLLSIYLNLSDCIPAASRLIVLRSDRRDRASEAPVRSRNRPKLAVFPGKANSVIWIIKWCVRFSKANDGESSVVVNRSQGELTCYREDTEEYPKLL